MKINRTKLICLFLFLIATYIVDASNIFDYDSFGEERFLYSNCINNDHIKQTDIFPGNISDLNLINKELYNNEYTLLNRKNKSCFSLTSSREEYSCVNLDLIKFNFDAYSQGISNASRLGDWDCPIIGGSIAGGIFMGTIHHLLTPKENRKNIPYFGKVGIWTGGIAVVMGISCLWGQ